MVIDKVLTQKRLEASTLKATVELISPQNQTKATQTPRSGFQGMSWLVVHYSFQDRGFFVFNYLLNHYAIPCILSFFFSS